MTRPNDYPSLNFDLGEPADMLRSFSDDEIAPIAAEVDRANGFPRRLWPKLGALGLLGITVEEEYGGAGAVRRGRRAVPVPATAIIWQHPC